MQQIQFIQTTPQELERLVKKAVNEALNQQPQPATNEPNDLLTIEEVAKIFQVSKNTIFSYIKKGFLTAYAVGRRNYFKRHEVENALIKIS